MEIKGKIKKEILNSILSEYKSYLFMHMFYLVVLEGSMLYIGIFRSSEFTDIERKISIIAMLIMLLLIFKRIYIAKERRIKTIRCQNLCIKRIEIFYVTMGFYVTYKTLQGRRARKFYREAFIQREIITTYRHQNHKNIEECIIKSDEICYIYKLKSMNMLLGYNEKGRAWCEKYTE